MTTETENAPECALQTVSPTDRICPGCGGTIQPGGRGMGRNFCSDPCRKTFRATHLAEGSPLAPLVKAWHATRHAPAGSREAEICAFARSEITAMARLFLDRDAEEGRDAVAYVGGLMDSGTRYMDRTKA